ncbi:uncharacterized protein [Littorina saxatilis]|uniref:uncharacterized protein n=1 Tax=Littorina saxatilis TaxID=31220 RepID=UPI0038B430B2
MIMTVCLNLKKAEMDSDLSPQQTTSPQMPLTQTVVSLLRPGGGNEQLQSGQTYSELQTRPCVLSRAAVRRTFANATEQELDAALALWLTSQRDRQMPQLPGLQGNANQEHL